MVYPPDYQLNSRLGFINPGLTLMMENNGLIMNPIWYRFHDDPSMDYKGI